MKKTLFPLLMLTIFALALSALPASAATPSASDIDGDGIPNIVDPDVDGDGIPNGLDKNVDGGIAKSGPRRGKFVGDRLNNNAPGEKDIDGDGLNDDALAEKDIDGDGLKDDAAAELDIDGDGLKDDAANERDEDGDGKLDTATSEDDIDGDGLDDEDATELDIDGDGDSDRETDEEDIDGDGKLDDAETENDIDGDGIPNDLDDDVDGDGLTNDLDIDTNGDGQPDEFDMHFGAVAVAGVGEAGGEYSRGEFDGTRVYLELGIEGVPAGNYDFFLGGLKRGVIHVGAADPAALKRSARSSDHEEGGDEEGGDDGEDSGGEVSGSIIFATHPDEIRAGALRLNFDPAGQSFQIKSGGTVYFAGEVPVPVIVTTQFVLTPVTGVGNGGGEFEEYELDGSYAEFGIEIENVPVGDYEVLVGGVLRGVIQVKRVQGEDDEEESEDPKGGGDTHGSIGFGGHCEGATPLEFAPAGATVVIQSGGVIYFTGTVPGTPAP